MDKELNQINVIPLVDVMLGRLPLAPEPRMAIVTAYGCDELQRLAEAAGIDELLTKPVSAAE